jgi:hypothetical protein
LGWLAKLAHAEAGEVIKATQGDSVFLDRFEEAISVDARFHGLSNWLASLL